jgi:hypothetical protein
MKGSNPTRRKLRTGQGLIPSKVNSMVAPLRVAALSQVLGAGQQKAAGPVFRVTALSSYNTCYAIAPRRKAHRKKTLLHNKYYSKLSHPPNHIAALWSPLKTKVKPQTPLPPSLWGVLK